MKVAVHLRVPHQLASGPADRLAEFVAQVEESHLDGLTVGDHVSFRGGIGYDGLVQATALASTSRRLQIWTAVYLLPLRHPVPVARQVSSLAALAPGRFVFGVGLGGDDRHELEVCGIDPRRRGKHFDTCLDVLRPLLAGKTVSSDEPELRIPGAVIHPAPDPPVPIIVGGRSDAAQRRAGRVGDGWIALWQSPERVAAGVEKAKSAALEYGRSSLDNQFAYTVWCGLDDNRARARHLVCDAMESLYPQPFSRFERYTPYGPAEEVAAALKLYIEAGIGHFAVIGVAADHDTLVAQCSEVALQLNR